jgi:hypothetical protein
VLPWAGHWGDDEDRGLEKQTRLGTGAHTRPRSIDPGRDCRCPQETGTDGDTGRDGDWTVGRVALARLEALRCPGGVGTSLPGRRNERIVLAKSKTRQNLGLAGVRHDSSGQEVDFDAILFRERPKRFEGLGLRSD